jgi:hypothetical protein
MYIQDQPSLPAQRQHQLQYFVKKLNAVLFYVITAAFSLLLLWLSAFLVEELSHSTYILQGNVWVGVFSAFVLVAMNISFLTLSTVMFMRAFMYKLWSVTEEWERYWNILINAFLILFYLGACFLLLSGGLFITMTES